MSRVEEDRFRAKMGSEEWYKRYRLIQNYRRKVLGELAGLARAKGELNKQKQNPDEDVSEGSSQRLDDRVAGTVSDDEL